MPKYFDTKKGSLESAVFEAVSPAQQAAIAISKKEKGEKPKNEKDENNYIHAAKMAKDKGETTFTIGGKEYDVEEALKTETNKVTEKKANYINLKFNSPADTKKAVKWMKDNLPGNDQGFTGMSAKGNFIDFEDVDDADKLMSQLKKAGLKFKVDHRESVSETNKNDKSDDGEGLDAVQPKAVKKKFADRKDKDIDNDGDVDDSDKFLHKRRKAVSKSMKSEEMDPTDHVKKKDDKYCVYNADGSIAKEFDNKEDADKYAIDNHDKLMATKKEVKEGTVVDAIRAMWEAAAKKASTKTEEDDDEEDKEKTIKGGDTTMTGKPMSKVQVSPKEKD